MKEPLSQMAASASKFNSRRKPDGFGGVLVGSHSRRIARAYAHFKVKLSRGESYGTFGSPDTT
jgi:hypothetical protein